MKYWFGGGVRIEVTFLISYIAYLIRTTQAIKKLNERMPTKCLLLKQMGSLLDDNYGY